MNSLLLLYIQACDKRGTAPSLCVYIYRARLWRVRWEYFWEKYHNSWKYSTSFLEELLKFIAHGHIFERIISVPVKSVALTETPQVHRTRTCCCAYRLQGVLPNRLPPAVQCLWHQGTGPELCSTVGRGSLPGGGGWGGSCLTPISPAHTSEQGASHGELWPASPHWQLCQQATKVAKIVAHEVVRNSRLMGIAHSRK